MVLWRFRHRCLHTLRLLRLGQCRVIILLFLLPLLLVLVHILLSLQIRRPRRWRRRWRQRPAGLLHEGAAEGAVRHETVPSEPSNHAIR